VIEIKKFDNIKLEKDGPIAILTLNRPDSMNSFTDEMKAEIIEAFDFTDADDEIRAVIFTGAGDRAFCVGADLSDGDKTFDFEERLKDQKPGMKTLEDAQRDGGGRISLRIFKSLKPVIAVLNGHAVGVGITMTLGADIRIASDRAKIGFVFNRRGVNPEGCSSWFLPRLVGISQALTWCYTGRVFKADEALRGGLVQSVHPREELMEVARTLALEIAENTSAVSTTFTRQMMWRMQGAAHPMDAHRVESAVMFTRGQSDDAKEGVMSFLEKRQPDYPDKVSKDMPDFFPWWEEPEFKWIGPK